VATTLSLKSIEYAFAIFSTFISFFQFFLLYRFFVIDTSDKCYNKNIVRHSDIDERKFQCGSRNVYLKQDPGPKFRYEEFFLKM